MKSSAESLHALFHPSSVAVVGASRQRGSVGGQLFHNLLRRDFKGVIYPVNPTAKAIQAVRAYRSVREIPDGVDMAVVVVPAKHVTAVVQECAEKRVKVVVIISAGFRETGSEGEEREKEVLRICRNGGMRLVGPNCLGVLNADPSVMLDATFAPNFPPAGNVAFLSQSGALGVAIIDYATELGIGISKFVSVGNKADVSANDLIEYWADDEKTGVILMYLESFGNPKRFVEIARRVSEIKPIVVVKSGRSGSGARAAASHTGALAGSEAAADALFRQTGVIRTDTVEQLFDTAMLLANQPLPKGRGVGILTNGGGPGILAADACERLGLVVPELKDETVDKLRLLVPPVAAIRNPVDTTAEMPTENLRKVIPLMLSDPGVDSLLVIHVPPLITRTLETAEAIVAGSSGTDKPVVTCFFGKQGVPEGLRSLQKGQIPSFIFPEAAVAALARAAEYSEWRSKPKGSTVAFDDFDIARVERISAKGGWLSPDDAFGLLEAARIPVFRPHSAARPRDAGRVAQSLGFPVALKLDSDKALHKTDVGGVALNLETEQDVVGAAVMMLDRAEAAGIGEGDIRGFLVQKMAGRGADVILGATLDPKFGHLFLFGLGGVHVELMRDVAFRLHPFTDEDVGEMIRGIRSYKLLEGYRGSSPCDVRCIEEILLRLAHLVTLVPDIEQFDLNPVRVFEKGAAVLDARIALKAVPYTSACGAL